MGLGLAAYYDLLRIFFKGLLFLLKSTRVLLRIVLETIKDMQAFFLFVMASTFALALLFTAATPKTQLHDRMFTDLLMEAFLIDFGDFSSD